MPLGPISWERDLLPEYLWLAALSEHWTRDRVHRQPFPAIGFLSDMAWLSPKANEIWARHESLLTELVFKPIGRVLALYPDNPAAWLLKPELLELGGPLNSEIELTKLRRLVVTLLPGRDGMVGHLHTLAVGRLAKHQKVSLPPDPMFLLFPKYPHRTSEDENRLIQSSCRALLAAITQSEERLRDRTWPRYFWRHNMNLLGCRPVALPMTLPPGKTRITIRPGQ